MKKKEKDFAEDLKDNVEDILNDVKDKTKSFTRKEIEEGKLMGIVSYLGMFGVIPYFGEKSNKYVIFHAQQGINLIVFEAIFYVIMIVLEGIFTHHLFWIFNTISYLGALFFFALSLIGIINVCNGKAKEIPIINKYKIIK